MFRFCSLGSGSTGNATLIERRSGGRTTRLLVDCGFSARELEGRLARAGVALAEIDAVFITHEHGDHVGCALTLARRRGAALWMSRGTHRAIGSPDVPTLRYARDGEPIELGDLLLQPYTVPHDASEPLQLCVHGGPRRLGLLTDAGSSTPHLLRHLRGCDALLLECNHDRAMLAACAYPASVKARIGGRHGHLANDTAAAILGELAHAGLRHLVAAHLSERNNTPVLARTTLAGVVGGAPEDVVVADPLLGFGWLDVG